MQIGVRYMYVQSCKTRTSYYKGFVSRALHYSDRSIAPIYFYYIYIFITYIFITKPDLLIEMYLF